MRGYFRVFPSSNLLFLRNLIRYDEIRRKVFGTESSFFFFWERVHVTSGENDRGRYPREGKGLVCAFAHAPRYRAER